MGKYINICIAKKQPPAIYYSVEGWQNRERMVKRDKVMNFVGKNKTKKIKEYFLAIKRKLLSLHRK